MQSYRSISKQQTAPNYKDEPSNCDFPTGIFVKQVVFQLKCNKTKTEAHIKHKETEKKRTFLPAILLERLPMERGEQVHMVLTEAHPYLPRYMQTHEDKDDIADEDDKLPSSNLFPDSQTCQFNDPCSGFQNKKQNGCCPLKNRHLLRRVKELGHLEETPLENLRRIAPNALIDEDDELISPNPLLLRPLTTPLYKFPSNMRRVRSPWRRR